MSLNSRIIQIAKKVIQGYVNAQTTLTNNSANNSCNITGIIASYDQGSNLYTVTMADGTSQTVSPGGLRPLGPGDGVIISNGAIIG